MSTVTLVAVLLVLVPCGAGVLLLLVGALARLAPWLAVATTTGTLLLAVAAAVTRPTASARFLGLVPGGDLAVGVDGLTAVLVPTVAAVALLVVVFAVADRAGDAAPGRFFGFLLLFVGAMLLTVTATTFPALLLGWEVMGATSYALIAFHWRDPGTVAAGTTAFLTTRAADLGLYVAAGSALAATGSLRLDDLATAAGPWADLAAVGVLVAALGKSAQLPFSGWLSAAMLGPSPVSALLHSATMVAAGGYLLLRLQPLLAGTGWAGPTAAWAGALTALVLGAVAVAQTDLKQLLAASTAAQLGFVVLAAGVGATAGGTAHLVAHAAVKAGLFVAAGAWLSSLGTKQLADLAGAARHRPVLGMAAVVSALALAGVPPLALWATKDEVLAGVGGTGLRLVTMAAAAVSAAYAAKVVVTLVGPRAQEAAGREEAPGHHEAPGRAVRGRPVHGRPVPVGSTVVAWVLAVTAVALGAVAVPAVAEGLRSLLDAPDEAGPSATELLASGLLALVVLVAALLRPDLLRLPESTPLGTWGGLRRVLSGAPGTQLAQALAEVDDRVLDRFVRLLPAAVRRGSGRLSSGPEALLDAAVVRSALATTSTARATARADSSGVDAAVSGVAEGLRRLGSLARRPQTGQLHQYYAMAAAGLGALLLILLLVR